MFANIKYLSFFVDFSGFFQKELLICALSNGSNQPAEVFSEQVSKLMEKKSKNAEAATP